MCVFCDFLLTVFVPVKLRHRCTKCYQMRLLHGDTEAAEHMSHNAIVAMFPGDESGDYG